LFGVPLRLRGGEAVACDRDGLPSFDRLRPAEGRIVVHTATGAKPANSGNEFDNWVAKKDANSPQGS
jgi:hypothetical protein